MGNDKKISLQETWM